MGPLRRLVVGGGLGIRVKSYAWKSEMMKIEIAILIVAALACVGGEGSEPSLYQEETKLYESMVHPVAGDTEKVAEEPVLVEELQTKDQEAELVQVPFYRTLFRGLRQHLSNYDHKRRHKKKPLVERDFVESNNALSSAATLASYANAKRLLNGKSQTRRLNGVLNPGFRHGPRNNEMDMEVRRIQSKDAERELKSKTDKLFGRMKEDVGGLGNFFRL